MNSKITSFLSLFIALPILITVVLGSVFLYAPGNTILSASSPDIIFYGSTTSGVTTVLGANKTSANITIKASTSPFEITTNGDFDSGPAPWTFNSGTDLNTALWYPTLYGKTGVAFINGSITSIIDSAQLIQIITWPSYPLAWASINMSYLIYSSGVPLFGLGVFSIGYSIYDMANNLITQGTVDAVSGNTNTSWKIFNTSLNTALFTPGENYYFIIEFTAVALPYAYVEYVLDYSLIMAQPASPYFLGPILYLNTTILSYNTSLILNSITSTGNANISIWLRNHTISVDSSKISIQNSVAISSQTSELIIAPVGLGYYSADIWLEALIDPAATITLDLTLKYRLYDNVHVEYPIRITIIDPADRGNRNYIPPFNNPVPFKPSNGG